MRGHGDLQCVDFLLLCFWDFWGGSSLASNIVCSVSRVAIEGLRPVRQDARVVAPVQRQMPDWMSFLPDVTRANAHLLTIWPALDYVEDDETE